MPIYTESRIVPYRVDQMFQLVSDIESYPEFLPWCMGARIQSREKWGFLADLVVGFNMMRETYTSRVLIDPEKSAIEVVNVNGPFRHLSTLWHFVEQPDGATKLEFKVDFEFKSKLLQILIGSVFSDTVKMMVGAFEARAATLYSDTVTNGSTA